MRKRRVLQVVVPFIMLIAVVAVPSAILADHSAGPEPECSLHTRGSVLQLGLRVR